jgi:hypothetical protein
MFSLSGQVASGLQTALDEVMERRLREQLRQQQEQQQAAQLALQQRQQQGVEDDRTYRRDNDRRVIDLAEMERIDAQAQKATDRNISLDAANVMNMPGMTPQARADELNQSVFRNPKASSAPDMRRVIEGLTKRPDRVQYTYTNPRTGQKATRFGNPDEMPAGGFDMGTEPQKPERGPAPDYEWVMRNGKPVQIRKGNAQMGDSPYEKAAAGSGAEAQEKMLTAADVKAAANALLKHKGFEGAFGLANSRMPTFSQNTADAEALRDRVSSLLQLANMGKMKGILSDSDMKVIKSASTTLSNRLSGKAARTELDRVIKIMDRIESGMPGMDMATSRDGQQDDLDAEIARIRAARRPGGR